MARSASPSTGRGAAAAAPARVDHSRTVRRLIWTVGLFAWAFLAASILSLDLADPPGHGASPLNAAGQISNWMGPVGAWVAYQTATMLGSGLWIIVISLGAYLAHLAFKGSVTQLAVRAVGVVMLALAVSGFHALLIPGLSRFPEGGGGLVAIAGVHELAARFGAFGAALWLTLLAVVGLTVAADDWFVRVHNAVTRPLAIAGRSVGAIRLLLAPLGRLAVRGARARANDVDDDSRLTAARRAMEARTSSRAAPAAAKAAAPAPVAAAEIEDDDELEATADDSAIEETDELDGEAQDTDELDEAEEEKEFDPEVLRARMSKLPVRFAGNAKRAATAEDLEALRSANMNETADREYVFPSLELLENPEASFSQELDEYVREQATALEQALHTYNIQGGVVGIDSGPVITLYQVRLAPGTKVSSITAVSSDLARALKSVNIRVVPNTEGLDTVGIEVPNRKKEKVRLKELMTSSDAISRMKLPLFLGKDASGNPLISDLASMPHMLIAGTTGSGKSVCMNAIIMGFLYTQKPSDLKLVMVDPKMVELSQFKDIPHLMCPVVTDMAKAAAILEWAVTKMDERYELLSEAGCRDISAYNSLTWEELRERFNPQTELEEARIPRKLPYMVFIIDELADLMMTNKEVEGAIVRIAQKARAVGIHLILATQRPQANVVTGLIKSNMPGRIAFKVASGMDSRIVLDQKGGELLLGQGDMLMITPRSANAVRAQGTLVDDAEIRRVVRFVREVSSPSFERQLVQMKAGGFGPAGEPMPGSEEHEQRMLEHAQEDPLFDRAVEIVLETRRGSVSLLQRRLAIGYTRASRLIELMGLAGIIGDHKGSVAREVQISIEEWEAMKKMAQEDAARSESATPKGGAPQPRLFTEPVVAREIVELKRHSDAAPSAAPAPQPTIDAEAEIEDDVEELEEPESVLDETDDAETETEDETEESLALAEDEADEALDEVEEDAEDEEGAEHEAAAEDEEELEETEDEAVAAEDEAEEADDSDDDAEPEASDEDDSEDDYEYEYVEVEEGTPLSDEYEVVEEGEEEDEPEAETPAKPQITTTPAARLQPPSERNVA